MERTASMETVATKFQEWARSLPDDEQESLATWMTHVGSPEIQGYASMWWQGDNAWCDAFLDCCP